MNTSLANRATVRELVAVFARAEEDVRIAFATIVRAKESLDAAFLVTPNDLRSSGVNIDASSRGHEDDFENVERCVERMRRDAWDLIIARLGVRNVMSISANKELSERLKKDRSLPVTEENVTALVQHYAGDLEQIWKQTVLEVYEWLRPRCDGRAMQDYKTNQRNAFVELGPRIVLTGTVQKRYLGKAAFDVNYCYHPHFANLDRVFKGLDGRGMTLETYYGPLVDAFKTGETGHVETDYFEARAYKNGSMHLRFKRLDLLARFNQVAGGARLRPAPEDGPTSPAYARG